MDSRASVQLPQMRLKARRPPYILMRLLTLNSFASPPHIKSKSKCQCRQSFHPSDAVGGIELPQSHLAGGRAEASLFRQPERQIEKHAGEAACFCYSRKLTSCRVPKL